MKFSRVVFITFLIISLVTCAKDRFYTHPYFLAKAAAWTAEVFIADAAKLGIKYSYNIHSAPATYAIDYGCEALYAGCTKGPDKIPHELAKYACAQKISEYANQIIPATYPAFIQSNSKLAVSMRVLRPFIITSLVRLGIDLMVDQYLEESEEDE